MANSRQVFGVGGLDTANPPNVDVSSSNSELHDELPDFVR